MTERYTGPYLFVPIGKRADSLLRGARHGCRPTLDHVIHALVTITATRGRPPTRRELAAQLGISQHMVHLHVKRGCRLGLLDDSPTHARTTRALTPPPASLQARDRRMGSG